MIGETTVHASPTIENELAENPVSVAPEGAEAGGTALPRQEQQDPRPEEFGGRPGPDPTRYGDWEKNGRCIDF